MLIHARWLIHITQNRPGRKMSDILQLPPVVFD
jgi:hypothetical protein